MRVDWHRNGFAIPDSSMNPNVLVLHENLFFFFLRVVFLISKLKKRANRILNRGFIVFLRDEVYL